MNNKKTLILFVGVVFSGKVIAENNLIRKEGFYIGMEAGAAMQYITPEGGFQKHSEYKQNTGAGIIKGGYSFGNGIRGELSYSKYGNLSHSDQDYAYQSYTKLQSETMMANAYYDIQLNPYYNFYIMGGLGFAHNILSVSVNSDSLSGSDSETQTTFAYQIGFGTSFSFTDNLIGDLGAKYAYHGRVLSETGTGLASLDYTISVRYLL